MCMRISSLLYCVPEWILQLISWQSCVFSMFSAAWMFLTRLMGGFLTRLTRLTRRARGEPPVPSPFPLPLLHSP